MKYITILPELLCIRTAWQASYHSLNLQWIGRSTKLIFIVVPVSHHPTTGVIFIPSYQFLLVPQFLRFHHMEVCQLTWPSIRSQTYGPCQFAEVQIPLKTVDQQMPPFGWDHLPPSIQALRHLSLHDHHLGRQISTGPGKSSLTLCTVGTLSGTTKILSQPPSPSLDRC